MKGASSFSHTPGVLMKGASSFNHAHVVTKWKGHPLFKQKNATHQFTCLCIKASNLTICNTWYGSLCLETWDLMFNYLYYTSNIIIHIYTHYSCVSATEIMSNQFCVFTTTFIKTTSSCITGYRNTYVHALSLSLSLSLFSSLSLSLSLPVGHAGGVELQ